MEIKQYINQKKDLYSHFHVFIENEDNTKENFQKLMAILENTKLREQKSELNQFLHLISKISKHCKFFPEISQKIENILEYLKEDIKKNFKNTEIFSIFKNNKRVLLYLIENKILLIDDFIWQYLLMQSDTKMCHFFYPEIKSFIPKEEKERIEEDISPNILSNFYQYRLNFANESNICKLIRNDSIDEFIIYVNKNNISLSSIIKESIFETDPFLIKNKETSLIEYAAFYGSIRIFQYILDSNQIELKPSLWIYAAHSSNAEIVQILEEKNVSCDNQFLFESIKCHHNSLADYILNNLLYNENEKIIKSEKYIENILRYHNYSYFPYDLTNNSTFFYLCKYGYSGLIDFYMQNKKEEFQVSNIDSIRKAAINNQLNSIYYLLLQQKIVKTEYFKDCKYFERIVIPPSIEKIEDNSFHSCESLKEIVLPSSLIHIGSYSFRDCRKLAEVKIPFSVTSIGNNVFRDTCIKKMLIPPSLNFFGNENLRGTRIEKVLIPSSINKIGGNSFLFCHKLVTISLPSSIKVIRNSAFNQCFLLTHISLPKGITCIRQNTFNDCINLVEIEIPSSARSIGKFAFYNCKSLKKVTFVEPSLVQIICEYAFDGCIALTEIFIPSSVKHIRDYAFYCCSNLNDVDYGDPCHRPSIGVNAFTLH